MREPVSRAAHRAPPGQSGHASDPGRHSPSAGDPSPGRSPDGYRGVGLPHVLRQYAFVADGERGAVIGPHGDVVWLCVPRWHDDAVFSALIGGAGLCRVGPVHPWHVWGGSYEPGTLIWCSRWVAPGTVLECEDALAAPAHPGRAVLVRRVRAVRGESRLHIDLDGRAEFGRRPMSDLHRAADGTWTAVTGPLHLRVSGCAELAVNREGRLHAVVGLPAGGSVDLVVEIGSPPTGPPPDPDHLWHSTRRYWQAAVPDCTGLPAARDAAHAYAVLRGLTSREDGMVAAATTSLPEHAGDDRNYDYRYAWIRDQCYAGTAVAAHGPHPLLDQAVRFVSRRILEDGPGLHPAYTVRGGPVPSERSLDLPGYPGGTDRVGNNASTQFQLDSFGEALQLFARAADLDRLDADGRRACAVAAEAARERWQEPEAGMWELHNAWWTHSRLTVAAGLRAAEAAGALPGPQWSELARAIHQETAQRCTHPSGRWQRAADDPHPDAALLLAGERGSRPAHPDRDLATLRAIEGELVQDGYVYRFRHDDRPLQEAEGAFLLCGFGLALAALRHGDEAAAVRWFERNRAACGPAGLFTEEYDVVQRQLRGNLPQAFVHALLLRCAAELAQHTSLTPG